MDPSYATLGFINFLALEFVYKARKTKCDFPDATLFKRDNNSFLNHLPHNKLRKCELREEIMQ